MGPAGSEVSIIDQDGARLPDGALGEIAVSSPSVAMGYHGDKSDPGTSTRFADAGVLHTGDAGFCHAGQVFVLGRMGSALKVRGKSVFMEDLETRLAAATGIPKGKFCAVAHSGVGLPGRRPLRRILGGQLGGYRPPSTAIRSWSRPDGSDRHRAAETHPENLQRQTAPEEDVGSAHGR